MPGVTSMGQIDSGRQAKVVKARMSKFRGTRASNLSSSKITEDDVPIVATLYFKHGTPTSNIASELGVIERDVLKLITGKTWSSLWARSVINLIASGVDCSRSAPREAREKSRRERNRLTPRADVLAIRQAHLDGSVLKDIAEEFKVSQSATRSMLRGDTFQSMDHFPDGWRHQ